MRYTLFLLTMFSIGPVLAEQIDDTFRIGQPFTIRLPEKFRAIQKDDFHTTFSASFSTFGDLNSETIDAFVRNNPEYFKATINYLHSIYKNRHISASQALKLRDVAVNALQKVELNAFPDAVLQQLTATPATSTVFESAPLPESQSEQPKWHGTLIASNGRAETNFSSLEQTEAINELVRTTTSSDEAIVRSVDKPVTQRIPHQFAVIAYSNNLSGPYDNVSTAQRIYKIQKWVAQGVKFESYIKGPWEDISFLVMGYHERVNYDFENSTGRERKYGALSGLLSFGRVNIFEGTGRELNIGVRRDRRSNKSYLIYPRVGLGLGWTLYAEYQDQFATDRWLYNSLDGRYQEPDQTSLWTGVTKSISDKLVLSTSYLDSNMKSDNGDSYDLGGWIMELGYYF